MRTEPGEDLRTEVVEVLRTEVGEDLRSEEGESGEGGRVTRETAGSTMTSEAPAVVEAGEAAEAARREKTRDRPRRQSK